MDIWEVRYIDEWNTELLNTDTEYYKSELTSHHLHKSWTESWIQSTILQEEYNQFWDFLFIKPDRIVQTEDEITKFYNSPTLNLFKDSREDWFSWCL